MRALRLVMPLAASAAWGQPAGPMPPPDVNEAVLRAIEASYASPEDRARLRVFHGLYAEADLATIEARAAAALASGRWDDPALMDESCPALDRAEAALARGDARAAASLAGESESMRARRIESEALAALGDRARAREVIERALRAPEGSRAEDMVERARAMYVRSRLRDGATPAGEYQAMLSLLGGAREREDRLYWPALVVEARILADKDHAAQAQQAAVDALELNPRAAEAWGILGQLAVDGFDMDRAGSIASRLERLEGPGGVLASSILAGARSRQNDPEGALEALAGALARFPEADAVRVGEIIAVARLHDAARTEEAIRAFEARRPGSELAELAAGRSLAEARQYDSAAVHLRRAAEIAPWNAVPWIELGLLGVQAATDAEALAALERAAELDPFNVRATNSLSLMRELVTYARVETAHFIIRHKPGVDAVLAREMPDVLEAIHARVAGEFDHEPGFKTLIDLMPDHRWFSVRIAGMPRLHTMAAATGPAVAMESPREGRGHMVGEYDWARVLEHEYSHTVTLSRTRNRIPHWFTEAAAVHAERAPRDFDRCQLLARALAEGTLFGLDEINIKFVRPEKATDRAQAYSQGHWMYQFIVERWGARAPLDLMDLYAAGVREDEAFGRVLARTPGAFMREFEAWAGGQVRSWGLVPPEGAPTIDALLALELDDAGERAEALAWSHASGALAGGGGEIARPALPIPTRERVERWLGEHPDHPDVLRLAVEMDLARRGGSAEAESIPLLERYARACPVDPLPHRQLARLYLSSDETRQAAIEHLEFLDAREQYSPTFAVELARRYAGVKDWPRACAKAERAVRIAPFDADHRELAATMLVAAGDLSRAERHLEALVELEPDREIHRRRLEALRRKIGGG